jgi:Lysozyme inhibitor LprI
MRRGKRDRAQARIEKLLKRLHAEGTPAQKAWEAYRDAQLRDFYPEESQNEKGSIFPLCLVTIETKLIEGRIRDLQALTIKYEGEGCAGFVLEGRAHRGGKILPASWQDSAENNGTSPCNGSKRDKVSATNLERRAIALRLVRKKMP